MAAHLREQLSDSLINGGTERALQRQAMERELDHLDPNTPGYWGAQRALRSAARFEALLLWLGWRLHPRTID